MQGLPYYLVGGTEQHVGVEVDDVSSAFTNKIQEYYPDNPVVWVSHQEVNDGLREKVAEAKVGTDTYVVTISSLYYNEADAEISCTRVCDGSAQAMGISHRPNKTDLRIQIQRIMKEASGRKIIVVDDTLFHGDTTKHLMKLGLKVDAVVEYFATLEGIHTLKNMGIEVYSVQDLDGYLDVLPLHDFLPGMPLCGKLIGNNTDGYIQHMAYTDGLPWALPYIYPYVSPQTVKQWASIPWDYVYDFSSFALGQAIIIANRLAMNGIYTLHDIARVQPHHVSIPYLLSLDNPGKMTVHEHLRRAVHTCMAA